MNDLNIPGTQSTPTVISDSAAGVLRMSGDSYPENSFEFFNEIIAWVENYLETSDGPLRVELRLVYMNTSSVRAMLDILDLLEIAHGKGREIRLDWFYDQRNERVVYLAAEFKEDCTFPFNITQEEPA